MLLPVPLLPQKVGNDITVGQVQDAGGIVVLVPGSSFTNSGDELFIRLNGNVHDTIRVTNPSVNYVTSIIWFYPVVPQPMALDYYIYDRAGNRNDSPIVTFEIVSGSVVNDYVLTAQVIGDGVPANGIDTILIIYRLTRSNVAAPNQTLQFFTGSPGLRLGASSGQTDANGQIYLSVSSTEPGSATIIANMLNNPAVIVNTQVNFRTVAANYRLIVTALNTPQPADGATAIIVSARLIDNNTQLGVANQQLVVSITPPAMYSNQVTTDNLGEAFIYIRATTAGNYSVLVSLRSDPTVTGNVPINFISSGNYPITNGPYNITASQYTTVKEYLAPFALTQGHVYGLQISAQPLEWENCGSSRVMVHNSSAQSACEPGTNDLEFLNTTRDLSRFRALKSGPGTAFFSQRYGRYAAGSAIQCQVKLIDYGPNASFAEEASDYQLAESTANLLNQDNHSESNEADGSDETFVPTPGN